jgi:hypothetical protein
MVADHCLEIVWKDCLFLEKTLIHPADLSSCWKWSKWECARRNKESISRPYLHTALHCTALHTALHCTLHIAAADGCGAPTKIPTTWVDANKMLLVGLHCNCIT